MVFRNNLFQRIKCWIIIYDDIWLRATENHHWPDTIYGMKSHTHPAPRKWESSTQTCISLLPGGMHKILWIEALLWKLYPCTPLSSEFVWCASLSPYHVYNDKLGVGIIRSSQPCCLRISVKRRASLFEGVPSLKVLWKPENAPWKRETIYRPSSRGVQITRWANCFTPLGFHQLFLQTFGRPIVGQLECFRLKDEDVLLLSRGIIVSFPFSCDAGCWFLGGKKGFVYQLQLDSCCVLFRGLGGFIAARLIPSECICSCWLHPGWFPMKYVELYKDVLNSVVV